MDKLKHFSIITLSLCIILLSSCSKSEENPSLSVFEQKMTTGFYYEGSSSEKRASIRFFPDNSFIYMPRNDFYYYDNVSEWKYEGKWSIENENDIILRYEYEPADAKAPTIILRTSFVDNKMYFVDQDGKNRSFSNDKVSTFIEDEMIGHTFKAGINFTYGGLRMRIVHTLLFKEDGSVKWSAEERFQESDVLRYSYSGVAQSWRNISEDEIYFEWFYDADSDKPYTDVVYPPIRMTDLRLEQNDKGQWLLYFENGYDYLSNTNFVRQ